MGLFADIRACQACPLHKYMICPPLTGFSKNLSPDIMIVGEAPGSEECYIEKPFQGLAGKLLTMMLNSAGVNRDNLYITNVVKCRPTVDNAGKKNRPPTKAEISLCSGWLNKEITIVNPRVIFALGVTATKFFIKEKFKFTDIIGQSFNIDNRIIIPCFHPSYLLNGNKEQIRMCTEIFKNGVNLNKGD